MNLHYLHSCNHTFLINLQKKKKNNAIKAKSETTTLKNYSVIINKRSYLKNEYVTCVCFT